MYIFSKNEGSIIKVGHVINICIKLNDDMLWDKKEILIRVPSLDSGEASGVASSAAEGVHTIKCVGRCLCTLIFFIIIVYFFSNLFYLINYTPKRDCEKNTK